MFDFQYEKTILIPSTVKDGKIIQSNGKPLPRIKDGAIVELTLNPSSIQENPIVSSNGNMVNNIFFISDSLPISTPHPTNKKPHECGA